MKDISRIIFNTCVAFMFFALMTGCSKDPLPITSRVPPVDTTKTVPAAFDINSITDTYESIAPFADYF